MITIHVFICFFNRGWITTWQRLKHRWERLPKTHRFAFTGGQLIATLAFFTPPLFTVTNVFILYNMLHNILLASSTIKATRNNAEFVLDNISDFHNILQCYLQEGTLKSCTEPMHLLWSNTRSFCHNL